MIIGKSKLTSFKSSDFIIGDEFGNLKLVKKSNGDFKGFKAGQVLAMMTEEKVQGGDAESKSVTVQFLDRNEWDKDYEIIESNSLDFDLDEIQGINGVELSLKTIPSNGETIVNVKAVLSADRSTDVLGLELGDFKATVDGVENVITAVAFVDGYYNLTLTTALVAATNLTIGTWDASVSKSILLKEDCLLQAESVTEMVLT